MKGKHIKTEEKEIKKSNIIITVIAIAFAVMIFMLGMLLGIEDAKVSHFETCLTLVVTIFNLIQNK